MAWARSRLRRRMAVPHRALHRRAATPATPLLLARIRVLFFLFGIVNLMLAAPAMLAGDGTTAAAGTAALIGLGLLWSRTLAAGRVSLLLPAAEAVLMYAVVLAMPVPEASLGVFYVGLNFGSLFRTLGYAAGRSVVLFLAFAAGYVQFDSLEVAATPEVWGHAWGAVIGSVVMALLARAVRAQAASERAKDEFLAVISHELRTPLTAILGFLHSLEDHADRLDPEQVRHLIARARANAQRQHQLIEDLLDTSRIVDGSVAPTAEPVPVGSVVQEVVAVLDVDEVTAVHVRDDHIAHVDRAHLHQILFNLLSNAHKYGAAPFVVTSWVSPTGEDVVVEVADHGPGIPAEFTPFLFDRFAQASTGDRRTAQGVGLGLWIARQLAHANDGDLWHTPSPTGGACFAVRVPSVAASHNGSGGPSLPATDVGSIGTR